MHNVHISTDNMNIPVIRRFNIITLKPHWCQFLINDLPLIMLCGIGWFYTIQSKINMLVLILAMTVFSLVILYHFAYLKSMIYRVTAEQLIVGHGIFSRSCDYIELYRVVDFHEHRSLFQQMFGLKTVSIYSGDRTNPRLEIIGLPQKTDLVSIIRERVEYNKQRKGVYEITNRY